MNYIDESLILYRRIVRVFVYHDVSEGGKKRRKLHSHVGDLESSGDSDSRCIAMAQHTNMPWEL